MPVYKVELQKAEPAIRLIEATNQAAAERFAAASVFAVTRPDSKELVALGKSGIEIEEVPEK